MTRILAMILPAVLATAALARAAERPLSARERMAPDSARVVEELLAEGIANEWTPPRERPVLASAAGGLLGWFFPQIYAWYPSLDGEMGEIGGDTLRFDEDLALSDKELSVVPGLNIQLGGWGVRFSAFFLHFKGSNVLQRDISFGGITFPVNEPVDSDIKLDNYHLMTVKPVVNTSALVIALQGGISWYSFDGSVTSQTLGSGRQSGDVPVPVIGVLLQMKVAMVLLELDVSGLSVAIGGIKADVLELQASAGVVLFKIITVRGGYRLVDVRGESSDFFVDATIDGFFIGVGFNF